jgi:hypothetical protein
MIRRLLLVLIGAILLGSLPAHADNPSDRVHFGESIYVPAGEEAHDVVCFLCSVEIDGTVHGDVVSFFGHVKVRGHAERDVVNLVGYVDVAEGATIGRDCVVLGGSLHTHDAGAVGRDSVVILPIVFIIPLALLALPIWLVIRLFRRPRMVYPPPGYVPQR